MVRRGRNGPGDGRFHVEESTNMKPSAIRYTQDSIKYEFSDGTLLTDTLRDLLYGVVTPEDIDTICVIWHDDNYYAVSGNRRLYLYKQMQNRSLLTTIPVNIVSCSQHVFDQYYTTRNYGKSIHVRGGTDCYEEVREILKKFTTDRRQDRAKERRNQRKIQQLACDHDEENQQHNVRPNTNYTPFNQDVVNRNIWHTPASSTQRTNVSNRTQQYVAPQSTYSGSISTAALANTNQPAATTSVPTQPRPMVGQNRPASSRSSNNDFYRYETLTEPDVDNEGNTSSGGLLSRIARLFTCCCRPSK